jgi:acyl-CoA thioesterase II
MDRVGVTIRDYLGLRPTNNPNRWQLELTPRVLTPAGAMHGGAALAATVEALEGSTDRPLVWATAHYLTHAGPRGLLDIDVSVEIAGHQTTQARAQLCLRDVEVLLTVASLGTRDATSRGRWVHPPDAPGPGDARPLPPASPGTESVLDHYEIRIATGRMGDELDGTPGPGRSVLWCRLPDGRRPVTAGDVAFIGDLLMLGLSDAIGTPTTANSLDNTIRIVERAPTEWVMLDVRIDAAESGYAHAGAHLWTDDGVLLGMATQTLVLRAAGRYGQSTRSTRRIVGDA